MKKSTDIDRSLAIFYHPLFQNITQSWQSIFGYDPGQKLDDLKINFIQFIEFNLKIQKCLLKEFVLENAFLSALNDWMKEILECYSYQELYQNKRGGLMNIEQELAKNRHMNLTFSEHEYIEFLELFNQHDAFKLTGFLLTSEVFCKFLFDLCFTWCEFLDIELFSFLILSILFNITEGERIGESRFKTTFMIQPLSGEFFEKFDQLKIEYYNEKRKPLRYYRSWCEHNYLKLNLVGESLIENLTEIYDPNEEVRVVELIQIIERSIDQVNSEIQIQQSTQSKSKKNLLGQQLKDEVQKYSEFQSQQQLNIEEYRAKMKEDLQIDIYKIEFDEQKGGLIIKRDVRMPVLGKKLKLQQTEERRTKNHYQKTNNQVFLGSSLAGYNPNTNMSSNSRNFRKFILNDSLNQVISNEMKSPKQFQQEKQIQRQLLEEFEGQKSGSFHLNSLKTPSKVRLSNDRTVDNHDNSTTLNLNSDMLNKGSDMINKNYSFSSKKNSDFPNKQHSRNNSLLQGERTRNSDSLNRSRVQERGIFSFSEQKHDYLGPHKNDRILEGYPKRRDLPIIDAQEKIRTIFKEYRDDGFGRINNPRKVRSMTRDETVNQHSLVQEMEEVEEQSKQKAIHNLIQQNRRLWEKHFEEEELYMLQDWDSLYKIITILRRKQQDKLQPLNYIKLDFGTLVKREEEMGGIITQIDKEQFLNRVQKLIKRDLRRKKRRQRRHVKFNHYQVPSLNRKVTIKKFKSEENKQLFREVFLPPLIL